MLSCPPHLTARIAANVAAVRAEIATACAQVGRDPAAVRLIAVTKSQGPEVLAALAAAGLTDFGENRLDHLALMLPHAPAGARFHAIGRVQGRQLAGIAADCAELHSLCATEHIARLARACAAVGRRLPVFIQVNAAGEASKAGLAPAEVPDFLRAVRAEPLLEPVGLMTMAPEGAPEGDLRAVFAALRALAHGMGLARLSMGMSQDFPLAIAEGATDIRVGTRLFA
jgi:pyridoxal phosphate enzyme (YggS family)